MMPATLPELSLLETRILGTLAEKERTVPDTYPLTLNALLSGCNQKTSRDPVLDASAAEIQAGIDSLKVHSLVIESSGGRVARYEHNLERVLQLPTQSTALLTVLMLRGPQTAGELRIATDRLHKFADISAVEGFLHELAGRPAGALVVELARRAGERETRWAQLLGGPPAEAAPVAQATSQSRGEPDAGELAGLKASVARLEVEVDSLKAALEQIRAQLGDAQS